MRQEMFACYLTMNKNLKFKQKFWKRWLNLGLLLINTFIILNETLYYLLFLLCKGYSKYISTNIHISLPLKVYCDLSFQQFPYVH